MERVNEETLPLPAPTPSIWTDLQRSAWLHAAVSQQRSWLLEKFHQSNDRTACVIEESCRALEARLLHAAGCADTSEGTWNDVIHDVTDKMPEPGRDLPPDPPIDLLPPHSQVPQSVAGMTFPRGETARVAGCVEAWAKDVDDVTGADDPGPVATQSEKTDTTTDSKFNKNSGNTRKMNAQFNQIRQLIGTRHGMGADLDRRSLRGRLDTCFQGRFDTFVGFLIVANTIVMFAQLQYQGQVANASLGLDYSDWAHAEPVFHGFDMFFSGIFLVEFLLRIYVYRCALFQEAFNILDAIVVPLTALNTFVISYMEMKFSNVSFIRLMRMFRVVRAFRVVRTMGKFKELRLLMQTIVASILALFWSMLIMFIFMLVVAILLCQTLHDFIADPTEELEMRLWANRHYGDGLKALYTVYEMTFSGCWPNYARPVIERVHPFYVIVFVIYVTAVVFALTRIVSAMFLKETLSQASHVAEMMVKEKANDARVMMANIRALFMAADGDGDGQVTKDELTRLLSNEKVKLWLAKLGVDASDPEALFNLLDWHGDGSMSPETFVTCMKKLKGEARAQDLIPVVHDCKQILNHCKALRDDHRKLSLILRQQKQEDWNPGVM